ncbi:MAG: carbonic anhydrase [Nitrospirales bacterium]
MSHVMLILRYLSMVLWGLAFFQTSLIWASDAHDNQASSTHGETPKGQHAHWAYLGVEDPSHWAMLSKEYLACEAGNRQSPINITSTHHGDHYQRLEFHYQTSELHEINNGHTIQVSHVSGCRVDLNDRTYKLRQFHFHSPSEHHIEGQAFPMEMHLVHQDEAGHVLVIAIMMKTDAEQPVLRKLWKWLPDQVGQEVSIPLELSLAEILPTSTHHYAYSGSLTTPPCTEGVQWIVLKEPMHVAQQDVDEFVSIIGRNARPIQPRRGRHIDDE